MSHQHAHDHSVKNIKIAFFLNLAFTIFEIIGGFYINSIAVLSDAVHDLGDSLSLGTSWYLQRKSQQKPDQKYSFGYRRFSLLGALINSTVLIGGSIFVIYQAIGRLITPEHSDANGMLIFALFGIAINGYAAWKLSKGKTLNERVVSWHLVEDVLGWVAILIVAIILQFKDIQHLDPALSLLITLYILWNTFKRLCETMFIFLQGHPADIDKEKIEFELVSVNGIHSIHDTHIWSLDGEHHVFTTHVKLERTVDLAAIAAIKAELKTILMHYPFEHFTIETELADEECLHLKNEKK